MHIHLCIEFIEIKLYSICFFDLIFQKQEILFIRSEKKEGLAFVTSESKRD